MTSDTLSDKRKDFKFAMDLAKLSPLAKKQVQYIFDEIEKQDREFILKFKQKSDRYRFHSNPQLDAYCHAAIHRMIDELAGSELTTSSKTALSGDFK